MRGWTIVLLVVLGVLLVAGVTFAVYLGVSSARLEHEREQRAGHIE